MALSGHGCFSRHRYLQGKIQEETCPFCLSDREDAEHFICHCPVFTRARLTHLGPNLALAEVCQPENISQLARYLRDTGRAEFFPADGPTEGEEDNAAGETGESP